MIFLLGEDIKTVKEDLGSFDCPVCHCSQALISVTDKSYFTVFFMRLFPLNTVAEYLQCAGCSHAFSSKMDIQANYIKPLLSALAYLMAGFGINGGKETVRNIYVKTTGITISVDDFWEELDKLQQNNDFHGFLKQVVSKLSWLDKSLIIEAAYLLVYSAREIEYEERVQINLIANSLQVSIEGVNAIIANLEAQQFKGFHAMQIPAST